MTHEDRVSDERLEVAEALEEFAMIDEAEGGNPLVISTERRAAELLRRAAGSGVVTEATFEHAVSQQTQDYDFKQGPDGAWLFQCSEWINITAALSPIPETAGEDNDQH